MLRFEYSPFDYRPPLTPHLSGVYFPSFNATIANINNDQSSDSEHSSFDDFSPTSFNDDNNNILMNEANNNDINENTDNKNVIVQDSSLLSDIVVDNPPSTADFYSNTPLFSPKTVTAIPNDFVAPPTTNTQAANASTNPLSEFVIADEAETSNTSMEINDLPLLPPLVATLPTPLAGAPETDDEEAAPRKKQKTSNSAPKKTTNNRRGRKPATVAASSAKVAPIVPILLDSIADKRKTSTGSDEDNDYSDSNPSSTDHHRTKHSISETRRRTRLRNQFKYLAEAAASTKTDRYSVLCAAIVKIEAAKRRIAELETALSSAAPMGTPHTPSVSPTPSSMCCAESAEYGVCSQLSGVATALLTGDGVGTFLSANHRWLALMGVDSLSELQSLAPSFLKAVGASNAEISNARSTLSAVSAHKHGSMTLPLDSNTILAFKNHSDSSIEPALLYANIRYFPTKSSRPALFTLSSYEHGAADNRNPCVLVTAVPCEPLPEGVTISSYNHRLAHRGRKAGHSDNSITAPIKKEGKKRSYNQRVSSSASLATEGGAGEEDSGSGRGLNAFVAVRNPLNIDNDF